MLLQQKSHIDPHTVVRGDFNNPTLANRQAIWTKLNRELQEVTIVINQKDLTDFYRTFHRNTEEYTFFSALHKILCKTDHVLRHRASFNRYEQIEITPCFLSD
jgi:exonuclease III